MLTTRPRLRRFGSTGLTFPEVGLAGDPAESDLWTAAYDRGVRFFRVVRPGPVWPSAPTVPESFAARPIAAAAMIGRSPLDDPPDLVLLEFTGTDTGADTDGLHQLVELKHRHRLRTVGAAVRTAAELSTAIEVAGLDAVELPFSAVRQEVLLECLGRLRGWGGAVIVRNPLEEGLLAAGGPPGQNLPATGTPAVDARAAAARELVGRWSTAGRAVAETALRFALLPEVVSVAVLGRHELAGFVGASPSARNPTTAELSEADAVLRAHGLVSGLVDELRPRPLLTVVDRPGAGHAAAAVLGRPLAMGSLRLANRIVRSATTERAVDADGLPTRDMRRIHEELAAGGAGMVVTGYLAVDTSVRASMSHGVLRPGPAVPAWAEIITACRDAGPARMCAQLGHGGALALGGYDEAGIVRAFRDAACAAAEAGFDAVQVHAAHGYLLGQLVAKAPPLRRRPVRHDGLETTLRVLDETCAAVQPDLAVLVKANVSDFVPGGYDVPDADVFADALARTRVSAVEWSAWTPAARPWLSPSRLGEADVRSEGYFVPFAGRVKARHPHLVVGSCGGFRTAAGMARAVTEGGTDFVALSRALVVEPNLPAKILAGVRQGACDGCNECLGKRIRPVHCPRQG
ncbi:hypothetical protein [Micromonospora sp. C95]|uniref:oxidoreductase n=1 Tax=Micromonospora sp. C95 TaxID=2824882 RepID=UPI001B35BD98|nr:hypothetical protein [Micromonospora sp. C95]MBQ1026038.1 hypothetical protein [Micromonospora sp. C95]